MNMKKKRLLAIVMSLCLTAAALAGCGGSGGRVHASGDLPICGDNKDGRQDARSGQGIDPELCSASGDDGHFPEHGNA